MTHQPTPKTAAFRSLVQQACTLNAEIATLDAAIRALDAIKARMGDCRDEADARKLLSELTRAEETVTIKRIREPRLKADLTELLTTAEDAFHPAHAEAGAIAAQTPKQAVSSFRDLLMVVQLDNEHAKTEKANEGAARAIKPLALARSQEDNLDSAWRAVALAGDSLDKRVEGLTTALTLLDKVLSGQGQIAAEANLLSAACEAFRKVFAKG
ncbi:MAG: hypothetical protein WCK77_17445 [Verrucomicrobiota bacterium]